MPCTADRKQRDHRTVMWKAVECARAHHGDAVKECGIDPLFSGEAKIGLAERVEGNSQAARQTSRQTLRMSAFGGKADISNDA
jgi:hypothetical protein